MVAKLTVGSGAVTVTPADPLTVSLVAVIMTGWASARTPVTSPVPETVATAGLLLAQVTTRSVSTLPLASFTVATSHRVPNCQAGCVRGDGHGRDRRRCCCW